jgi:Fe-S cluster assembly iron-binding protein IscA
MYDSVHFFRRLRLVNKVASQRLSQIMKKDSNPNLALRIQVESGGCHGFQYLMSLVTIPPKTQRLYLMASPKSYWMSRPSTY